jgi:Flp pilus assembly protein TadG
MARKPPLTWRLGWDRQRRDESGFTIVEVMVAVFLLLVGVLGSVSMFDGANAASGRTRAREAATNLAREVVEAARGVPYGQATGPALESQLQAQPGLGDASPSAGW